MREFFCGRMREDCGKVAAMSIVTKRGDEGQTDLLFGKKAGKSSQRVACFGAVDELNSALGMVRAVEIREEAIAWIDRVQEALVRLMGEIAALPEDVARYREKFSGISHEEIEWLEGFVEEKEKAGIRFTGWARPGAEGSLARAAMDFSRSVCRRAERECWVLHEQEAFASLESLIFLNRLSDALWMFARQNEAGEA